MIYIIRKTFSEDIKSSFNSKKNLFWYVIYAFIIIAIYIAAYGFLIRSLYSYFYYQPISEQRVIIDDQSYVESAVVVIDNTELRLDNNYLVKAEYYVQEDGFDMALINRNQNLNLIKEILDENEIFISKNIAAEYEISINDTLSLMINDKPTNVLVKNYLVSIDGLNPNSFTEGIIVVSNELLETSNLESSRYLSITSESVTLKEGTLTYSLGEITTQSLNTLISSLIVLLSTVFVFISLFEYILNAKKNSNYKLSYLDGESKNSIKTHYFIVLNLRYNSIYIIVLSIFTVINYEVYGVFTLYLYFILFLSVELITLLMNRMVLRSVL